jgi:hypothetical protein
MLIPRRFHWIWFGPEPLSDEHALWREGWLRHHPGWEGKLWTEKNLPELVNKDQFHKARSFAQKADIARYEIIHREGGIYVDTDMECLTNLESVLAGLSAFAAWDEPREIGTAIFGATAGHPWLASVIAQLPRAMAEGRGILHETGPRLFTAMTQTRSDVMLFAMPAFYDGLYARHHKAASWLDRELGEVAARYSVVVQELDARVPAGATFICVDDDIGIARWSHRKSLSLTLMDGKHIGPPADGREAVDRVRRLRAEGANFIAFIDSASWWIDYYDGLRQYLDESAYCIVRNNGLMLFDLGS